MEPAEFLRELMLIDDDPDHELSPHAMRTYVYLRLRSAPFLLRRPARPAYEEVADFRIAKISEDVGMSDGAIIKGIRELEAKGILDVLTYRRSTGQRLHLYAFRPWMEWRHYTNERSDDTPEFPEPQSYRDRKKNLKRLKGKADRLRAQIEIESDGMG